MLRLGWDGARLTSTGIDDNRFGGANASRKPRCAPAFPSGIMVRRPSPQHGAMLRLGCYRTTEHGSILLFVRDHRRQVDCQPAQAAAVLDEHFDGTAETGEPLAQRRPIGNGLAGDFIEAVAKLQTGALGG